MFYSAVPDFIDIYYKNFHWFTFNVADIFITLGVIILILNEFFLKINNEKFFIFILFLNFLYSCQSVTDGFKLKKDTADEFLVEKKIL